MPRVDRSHQRADGALMFLESLRAGLTPPELPGARCAQPHQAESLTAELPPEDQELLAVIEDENFPEP